MKPNIIKLDYSSLDIFYNWLKKNKISKDNPFCIQWKTEQKILNYIGTIHTFNDNNATCLLMKKIMTDYKPQIVIIEGFNNDKGINPEIPKRLKNTEMEYLALLCKKFNINYVGIETRDKNIYDIIKDKYAIDDIYGYLFLQMYRVKTKRHISEDDFLRDFYERILVQYQTYIKKINWNHEEWFKKTFNKKFVFLKYLKYSEPKNDKNALITQKISFDWHKIRDMMNIYKLYEYLNKYDNVLYSMGRNHPFIDKQIISENLGQYKIII